MASDFKKIVFPTPSTSTYVPTLDADGDYYKQNELFRRIIGSMHTYPFHSPGTCAKLRLTSGTVIRFQGSLIEATVTKDVPLRSGVTDEDLKWLFPFVRYNRNNDEYKIYLDDKIGDFNWSSVHKVFSRTDSPNYDELLPYAYLKHTTTSGFGYAYGLSTIKSVDLGLYPDSIIVGATKASSILYMDNTHEQHGSVKTDVTNFKNNTIYTIMSECDATRKYGYVSDNLAEGFSEDYVVHDTVTSASLEYTATAPWKNIYGHESGIGNTVDPKYYIAKTSSNLQHSLAHRTSVARASDVVIKHRDTNQPDDRQHFTLPGQDMDSTAIFRIRGELYTRASLFMTEEDDDNVLFLAKPLDGFIP